MPDSINLKTRYYSITELPVVMKVSDLQALFGISRSASYRLLHTPGFPVIRVGGMLRIPRDRLFDWMELQSLENTPNQNPRLLVFDIAFCSAFEYCLCCKKNKKER